MKYMGSKARYAKEILEAIMTELPFPNSRSNWVEPFVGGGNMIAKVSKIANRYGNDMNEYVIALLKEVQNGWIPPEYVTEEVYKEMRELSKSKQDSELIKATIGFVGIGCSYSGKWFGGFARNVGKEKPNADVLNKTSRNYCAESKRNILKQVPDIQNVIFTSGDYREMKSLADKFKM